MSAEVQESSKKGKGSKQKKMTVRDFLFFPKRNGKYCTAKISPAGIEKKPHRPNKTMRLSL